MISSTRFVRPSSFAFIRALRGGVVAMLALTLVVACSSTRKENAPPAGSQDILDLLTGFGESISKRDFVRAVGYLTPQERNMMLDANGRVPEDKQRQLMSLRLQRLIRTPSVRVEGGYLAGIYDLLPNERQADVAYGTTEEGAPLGETMTEGEGVATTGEETASTEEDAAPVAQMSPSEDPALKEAVNKFFKAVNQKNWNAALALMHENERKVLVDEKGKIKNDSKARLQNMDQNSKEALMLQDGKLTGVTLLLPAE